MPIQKRVAAVLPVKAFSEYLSGKASITVVTEKSKDSYNFDYIERFHTPGIPRRRVKQEQRFSATLNRS